eukprot:CAMPEP_0115074972 /NCGR_PEP_ID=MMETSP0227-20121206/15620_1 /TAXON_ID=89957 /ORGANISM="Polarella glacialis, Strain CCMP 1383" /LENGTH=103 /DNA_ID=CAMNT_0002461965 /DNA_START=156 /DNA_END=468 /DNA_ORIENTATION=+
MSDETTLCLIDEAFINNNNNNYNNNNDNNNNNNNNINSNSSHFPNSERPRPPKPSSDNFWPFAYSSYAERISSDAMAGADGTLASSRMPPEPAEALAGPPKGR